MNFEPAVLSLTAGTVCKKGRGAVGGKKWGWCALRLPNEEGNNTQERSQYCQNCARNKQRSVQTCKKCRAKIDGEQGEVCLLAPTCTVHWKAN
eukprot:404651-Amphidinium_carterae.1